MPKACSVDMRTRVIARVESGASRREAEDHEPIFENGQRSIASLDQRH